ncbi:geranylgeranyl reductase [Erythrobacter litoralis]|jgi:geranylgeranyl reductase|uniref:geranylgeranyl diphosphate reductase n=1 Tax=Erythrobacter litoralis TaxID=39960 RepID=A0A074MLV9_9SPHN|nr:geranylgeranyl diphosphate reductase [Erythrobacter litoralis]AOL22851.1 geranylgeranyl reductase [Erythrobacter litoralis]KEO92848.1 geranylgeranyl diphosphate reductase [Erythrobacter litoralis]MEE4338642.1 geranylgeranyl diphosphate reductase [Erythrobacter sp.]
MREKIYDAVVVGGGPSGATAATDLALAGHSVLLLERGGRIKPCGGAVPPRLMEDFDVPQSLLVARARSARMIAPSGRAVDMPVGEIGYVGMVDREEFDEWLRERARYSGAERLEGTFEKVERDDEAHPIVTFRRQRGGPIERVRARCVIGADGARSAVAKQCLPGAERVPCVFAYHEIIKSPEEDSDAYDHSRCDVFYQGKLSPDFYAWVFPHGETASVGVGSANKGFSLRGAISTMRADLGLTRCETVRREGAPIPLKPLKRWDNGADVIVAGDAAGVVAPASGEGIYYAMTGGRMVAEAASEFLKTGEAKALKKARSRFMREHGKVFWVLGMMQYFWYSSDKRRERFVTMCDDKDVQQLTWQAYMNKKLVRAKPMAHVKIFLKDTAHLLGLREATR